MSEITVILPSYNVVEYIGVCLESVARQTMEDIEIICVDANSSDGTLEVIRQYMALDKRIKLILSEEKSFGHQMNLGMEAAQGNYIAFVETDDYIMPDMFARLYRLAQEHDVDIVKADFDNLIELPEKQIWRMRECFRASDEVYYDKEISIDEHPELYAKEYLYWRGLYKKSFLLSRQIRFHESSGASNQDIGFFYQTYLYAEKMYFVKDAFYQYRRNRAGASLFDVNALEKLMKEYQYIETEMKRPSDRMIIFEPYYYYRMFRQVHLRIRLTAMADSFSGAAISAVHYFKELLNQALQNGRIDEIIFGNENYTKLLMFLMDSDQYIRQQKLLFQAQYRQINQMITSAQNFQNIILFGSGKLSGFCNCVLQSHGITHIQAFCDNNRKLQGDNYMGRKIISPEEAVMKYKDALYVLTGSRYHSDMKKQLIYLGVPENNISVYQLGIDWLYLK